MEMENEDYSTQIDFKELIESLNMSLVALDSDWKVQYHNTSSRKLFKENDATGLFFWDSLKERFKVCLEDAYKKALLGERDQLGLEDSTKRPRSAEPSLYDDMPLDMIEQKPVSFEYNCESLGRSYAVSLDLHHGHFLFRVEDITQRVQALVQAQKNHLELEEALERMREVREANPLTGLPGNITIKEQIRSYLADDETFALIYADLDHFKPYNDRYGFERGNEVILLLRDILEEAVEQFPSRLNFVGHIGGDDFVLITSVDRYEPLCEWIIERFDDEIPEMYDKEHREAGGIRTTNREGEELEFDFITISLAVVTNDERSFDSYLEMTEETANVKQLAKQDRTESNYRVDRRTD